MTEGLVFFGILALLGVYTLGRDVAASLIADPLKAFVVAAGAAVGLALWLLEVTR